MGKVINLKSIHIENFKGISNMDIQFGNRTKISGQNAAGKTTILDAFNWCLFNANSQGETKFEIRPLDEWGNKIHNVEIKVSMVLDIDGETTEFTKIQKENWVKHRGHEEAVLEGNPNSYEIDGYPKKEKDYNAFIQDIISADTFKMLADPRYFPNLSWKEQRKVLMSMYEGKSDSEIAKEDERFSSLVRELDIAPSTDDIKAKYQKAFTEYKKKLNEIPVRIDELSKSKIDIDVSELELQKKELEEKIKACENEIKINSNKATQLQLEMKKNDIQMGIDEIVNSAKNEKLIKKAELEANLRYEKDSRVNSENNLKRIELFLQDSNKKLAESEHERTVILSNEYKKISAEKFNDDEWKFDENTTICSLCGQKLPGEKIEQLKAEFEDRLTKAKEKFEKDLAKKKKSLIDRGNDLKTLEAGYKDKIEQLSKEKDSYKDKVKLIDKTIDEINEKLLNFDENVDLSDNQELSELHNELKSIEDKLAAMNGCDFDSTNIEADIYNYKAELSEVNERIASVSNNIRIDERIAELEKEQLEIAQKSADQERMIYLLEEFIKFKLELISSTINSHFKSVSFKLFNVQMNGGLAETCECLIDGVPYSDANSGHKLVAGLDIIQALQDFYGIQTVAFLDNAESLNTFNIPNIENQLISLSVSEDKTLKVEV